MKRSRLFAAIIFLLIPWMNLQLQAQQPDKNKHKSSSETKLQSKEVKTTNYDKAVKLIKLIRNSLERIYCTRNDYKNPKKDEEIKELRGLLNELIEKYENIVPSLRKELDQQRIEYKQAFTKEDVDKVLKTHQNCKQLESIIYELTGVLSNASAEVKKMNAKKDTTKNIIQDEHKKKYNELYQEVNKLSELINIQVQRMYRTRSAGNDIDGNEVDELQKQLEENFAKNFKPLKEKISVEITRKSFI